MSTYGKAIAAVVMAVLVTVQTLSTDGISAVDWASIVVAFLTAVGVWLVPEVEGFLSWAKTAVAVMLAAAQAAVQVAGGGVHGYEWLTIAIAALGVLGVSVAPSTSVSATRRAVPPA
jgi:hypothetical protein